MSDAGKYDTKKLVEKGRAWWKDRQANRDKKGSGGAGPGAAEKYQQRMAGLREHTEAIARKTYNEG